MAKFDYDYEVCLCNKVTLGEIIYAIKEKNATTIKDIQDITTAGTICKSCISKDYDFRKPKLSLYLEDILYKVSNEK